jgi:hypothetical protein
MLPSNTWYRRLFRRKPQCETLGKVRCCYDAGPTGYALHRQLEAAGMICEVVARRISDTGP